MCEINIIHLNELVKEYDKLKIMEDNFINIEEYKFISSYMHIHEKLNEITHHINNIAPNYLKFRNILEFTITELLYEDRNYNFYLHINSPY